MPGVAAADDARPRDLFGFDEPRDAPATCADAESLPCPIDPQRRHDTAPAAWVTRLARAQLARLPLTTADLDSAAGLAVGAGRDDGGVYYGGATSVDNRYLVDGVAIDSPRLGNLGVRVPLAFLDEVVITTAGFSVRDRAATGAVIDARLREGGDDHVAGAGVWLGVGAPPRLTETVAGEYRAFRGRLADTRTLDAELVADGPLARARRDSPLWYAAGVAPRLWDGGLVRDAWRLTDRDGDLAADAGADGLLVHESLGTTERDALAWSVPMMARTGAAQRPSSRRRHRAGDHRRRHPLGRHRRGIGGRRRSPRSRRDAHGDLARHLGEDPRRGAGVVDAQPPPGIGARRRRRRARISASATCRRPTPRSAEAMARCAPVARTRPAPIRIPASSTARSPPATTTSAAPASSAT